MASEPKPQRPGGPKKNRAVSHDGDSIPAPSVDELHALIGEAVDAIETLWGYIDPTSWNQNALQRFCGPCPEHLGRFFMLATAMLANLHESAAMLAADGEEIDQDTDVP